MMQKSTTFTTIFRVKKCHFHYDRQKIKNMFQFLSKIFFASPVRRVTF
jgi:hypothetical protein